MATHPGTSVQCSPQSTAPASLNNAQEHITERQIRSPPVPVNDDLLSAARRFAALRVAALMSDDRPLGEPRLSFWSRLMSAMIQLLFFWQPYRHSRLIADISMVHPTGEENQLENYWASQSDEAKVLIQTAGILSGLLTLLFPSATDWPLLDAVLHTSLVMLLVSIVMHCVAIFYFKAMQTPAHGHWLQRAQTLTTSPSTFDPWIACSLPTAWTFWGTIVLFIGMFMSAWRVSNPAEDPARPDTRSFEMPVAVTGVLVLGLACTLSLMITWQRYTRRRVDATGRAP